jgi:hypothetical protein
VEHDYAEILKRRMRKIVANINGQSAIADNPALASTAARCAA